MKHVMMATPTIMMDAVQIENQLNKAGCDQEGTKPHPTHAHTETAQTAGIKMTPTIRPNVPHAEVTVKRLVQRDETMAIQKMEMAEKVTVHQLKKTGYAQVDQRLQLTLVPDDPKDTIKITPQIQKTAFQDVEMDLGYQKLKSATMEILRMATDDHQNA